MKVSLVNTNPFLYKSYISIYLCIFLSIYITTYLFIYLTTYLFIYLTTYLSNYYLCVYFISIYLDEGHPSSLPGYAGYNEHTDPFLFKSYISIYLTTYLCIYTLSIYLSI